MRKGKTLSVYLPEAVYDRVRQQAEELCISVSSYVTMLLVQSSKKTINMEEVSD